MKKLLFILFLLPIIVCSQGFKTPEIKYGKGQVLPNSPQWVQLMYSENPDPGLVSKMYTDYYMTHAFKKNTHTQYYKRWLRSFSRDNSTSLNDDARKAELKKLEADYLKRSEQLNSLKGPNSAWQGVGPHDFDKGAAGMSYAAGAGHVYTIEQSLSNDSVLFCGTATAGVWKSVDKGQNWNLVTRNYAINSVVALEIDPQDEDIVYFGGADQLYKSVDGGQSWNTIGNAAFTSLDHYIADIKIKPDSNSIVFVCSDNALYRSDDSGNNFTQVLVGDFQEIEFNPSNPNMVYVIKQIADRTEFYKSTDGGLSFYQVTNGWPNPASGDEQKRTEIATSPANPNKVYALCTGVANGGSGLYGIYISTDLGETWSRTCCGSQVAGVPSSTNLNLMGWDDQGQDDGGQYYYDLALEVDDTDEDKIYVAGVNLWISTDGGVNFTCPSKWSHSYKPNYVHADIHDVKSIGNELWVACDGGAFYSSTGASIFERRMLGIEGTDFWGFGAGFWDGEVMIGGTYHNGTLLKDNQVYINGWLSTGGGDNIRGFVNPGDNRKVYQDYGEFRLSGDRTVDHQSLNFYKLPNASYIFGKSSNIAFHPLSHNSAYVGQDSILWLTNDDGGYYEVVHNFGSGNDVASLEVARTDPNRIYVSTFPDWWATKKLYTTADGGETWTELIIPSSFISGEEWIPYDIAIDAEDPNVIWLARTSMYNGYPDYDGVQVLKSVNAGVSWVSYSTSTLDGEYPTNIVHQAGTDGGVYLGTRRGVYYRDNTMNDWALFNNNLPVTTPSTQLIPYYRKGLIRNGTSRSTYECEFYGNSSPLAHISLESLIETYCPGHSVQFHESSIMNEAGASWQWIFEGGQPATSTSRSPLIEYPTFGEFNVTLIVTDTFGVDTQTLENFVVIEDCYGWDTTSIGSNVKRNLDVFPSLTNSRGVLTIKNLENQNLNYRLYSAKGKLVKSEWVENNSITLPSLNAGVYFLSLIGEKSILNTEIVIE